MSFDKNYQPASFRNIRFLVETESADRGKKYTIHEYPNSNNRYVEELGTVPATFSIKAIVHGEDAITKRKNLENALEKKGLGLLVHPIYGRINVMALTFSVTSSQTNIGIFTFDIRFSKSLGIITADPDVPTATQVSDKAAETREKLDEKLGDNYQDPTSSYNYTDAKEKTESILKEVNDRINSVVDLSSKGASNFNRKYRSIVNDMTRIISSAQEIRSNITSFYTTALDAPVYVEQLGNAWDNLMDYPLTVPLKSPITIEQAERQQNYLSLTEHMRLTALIGSYESKAHKEYTTDTELVSDRSLLDTKYRLFTTDINNQIDEVSLTSLANDPDVRKLLAELRVIARQVFDEKEKTVFRIVDINPGRGSMALTCFRYYGSLDNIAKLTELNPSINHANFYEIMKALTQ